MGILAVGKPFHRRIAGHVDIDEPSRETEQLLDDPRQVVLGNMLEHVGADDAVELHLRQLLERLVSRIVAGDRIDAPKGRDGRKDPPIGELHLHLLILAAFARSIIEDRAGARGRRSWL